MRYLFSIITMLMCCCLCSLQAAQISEKGGELVCYQDGVIYLCTKSECFKALIKEMRNEIKYAERKEICKSEGMNHNATSIEMLRLLTNAKYVKSLK